MEDLLEQANEIQESLGRSYAVPDELDEADLEAGAHTMAHLRHEVLIRRPELDALALEVEEEGESYLADLNKTPDFIDEAPVEAEVSISGYAYPICSLICHVRGPKSPRPSKLLVDEDPKPFKLGC